MIVFKTDTVLPLPAFTTFGMNVKPNTTSPLGYFGTGLKNATAIILRLGGSITLITDGKEYEFYCKKVDFRGKEFDKVRMKKRTSWNHRWSYHDLPFTTELGKHWDPWMAVRELESNTRDENGISFMHPDTKEFIYEHDPEASYILVKDCPEFEKAYWNAETDGSIFIKNDLKLLHEIGPLQIFEGESAHIYYRGLRVTDLSKKSMFTYNFTDGVTLTEDRTSRWPYSDAHRIMESYLQTQDVDLLHQVMDAPEEEFYESGLPFDQPYAAPSPSYMAALGSRMTTGRGRVPTRMKSYYKARLKENGPVPLELSFDKGQVEAIMAWANDAGETAIYSICKDALEDSPF